MNFNREDYLEVCNLPYDVTMTFGKSGAPKLEDLRPEFRRLGSNKCVAKLQVHTLRGKEATVRLPETLAKYGEGRYELVLHDTCCQTCDTVEIWFTADCEIVKIEGKEPKDVCHDC